MSVYDLPIEVQREFLALKRDAEDPSALRRHLQHGWGPFQQLYGRDLEKVRVAFERRGVSRGGPVLARALWMKAEVLFHIDFRCKAYDLLTEAYQMAPEDPDILGALIRVELTHGRLRDAALHLFAARTRNVDLLDRDLLEEDLERAVREDVENEAWDRIQQAEDRLARDGEDPALLTDLAAEHFYEMLDLETGEAYVARAEAAGSRDPETAFIGAEIAFEAGRPEQAMARLRQLRLRAPDDARGPLLTMNVLCSQGLYKEALEVLRKVVGSKAKPLRVTCQDTFFQGNLNQDEEYHAIWLRLLRRLQVAPDGIGYFYSSGTPSTFFKARLEAARVYHAARSLALRFTHGDVADDIEAGFRALLAEAPEYTFLLDEFARFLLLSYPSGTPQVAEAEQLATLAVRLAELAGEPESRFHATLAAAQRACAQ